MFSELMENGADGAEALVRLCSWCKRMEHEAEWVDLKTEAVQPRIFARSIPPQVTHGICGDCSRQMLESLEPK